MTRNAAQAFAARSGNCLSLVIMTAAFAKEMGLPVAYQNVYVDETWSRIGDIYFSIGHVNLTLGRRHDPTSVRDDEADLLTIDFLPPSELRGLRTRVDRRADHRRDVHEQSRRRIDGARAARRRLLVGARGDRCRTRDS